MLRFHAKAAPKLKTPRPLKPKTAEDCPFCRAEKDRGTAVYRLKTSSTKVALILAWMAEGVDVPALERVFGIREGKLRTWPVYGMPTGVVTVTVIDTSESCIGFLVDGSGNCEISLDSPGIYTYATSYSGDENFLPSSESEMHEVLVGTLTEIITDFPDPSLAGEPISVTFSVTSTYGLPIGNVTVIASDSPDR